MIYMSKWEDKMIICPQDKKELVRDMSKPHYPKYICPECKQDYVYFMGKHLITEKEFKDTAKIYNEG